MFAGKRESGRLVISAQGTEPSETPRCAGSAVFISWVMRKAGAGTAFAYSTAHREYVSAAKRNAESGNTANPFWAYPVEKIAPAVGDLVCADREMDGRCGGVTYATVDNGTAWSTHCDVVTAVDRAARRLTVVGGNVSHSVKGKLVEIDAQGFVVPQQASQTCRYFAVLKLRDGVPATQEETLDEDGATRANRLNTSYASALGWSAHLPAIRRLLPPGVPFARAVARWQHGRGLTADGVIGPDCWDDMRKVLLRGKG